MTETKHPEPIASYNIMRYHVALSLVDSMEQRGIVSKRDKDKLYTKIAAIYRLPKDSIFAA